MMGQMGDPTPEESDPEVPSDPSEARLHRIMEWGRSTAAETEQRARTTFDTHRNRPLVDVCVRFYGRDREAAGALVGSAVAFRLFMFFVPLLLFLVGLLGFLGSWFDSEDVEATGVAGVIAKEIGTALTQPGATRWIATIVGLFGMLTAGRSLSKVMTAASCLSWQLPVRTKASFRAVGATIGLIFGLGVITTVVNKLRQDLGIGVASISLVLAAALYALAWILLTLPLPRATSDPGALLPGAMLAGLVLAGLQAFSQLYLPSRFSGASSLYGAMGAVIVSLGWFFIAGRIIVLSFTLNAVIYERFGSISTFTFGLPVVRVLPRRFPWLRRFFDLPDENESAASSPPSDAESA
jgi:uncharacterized BrkB/YihY/UPF0761 family membrane protein